MSAAYVMTTISFAIWSCTRIERGLSAATFATTSATGARLRREQHDDAEAEDAGHDDGQRKRPHLVAPNCTVLRPDGGSDFAAQELEAPAWAATSRPIRRVELREEFEPSAA
jgi:hypothetical protein